MSEIAKYIPVGYENRISREYLMSLTGETDRANRHKIEKHNCEIGMPIISADGGYFIPNMEHEADVFALNVYFRKERSRINRRSESLTAIRTAIINHERSKHYAD